MNANGKNQSERCKGVAGKRPKRPRDFSQAAKLVVDIATGQVEDREPTRRSVRASKAFKKHTSSEASASIMSVVTTSVIEST